MTLTYKHAGPISAGFRGSAFKRTPVDAEERQAIIAALQTGQPINQIAREHRRSESAVREIARVAGLIAPATRKEAKAAARDMRVSLSPAVASLLEKAAARRKVSPPQLLAQIVVGVLTRSTIDKPPNVGRAIELCANYLKKQKRVTVRFRGFPVTPLKILVC
jgi:hypothetical protein